MRDRWAATTEDRLIARENISGLAGVEGLEPPTPGFGDRCSSQLSYTPIRVSDATWPEPASAGPETWHVTPDLERVKGIEPSSSAWKAAALPLSYTRKSILFWSGWWRG